MSPLAVRLQGQLYVVGGGTSGGPGNLPPTTPGGLSVSQSGPSALVVAWGPASDPDGTVAGYELSVNGGAWLTAVSPHTLSGLSPATTYTVAVRAVDDRGTPGPALFGSGTTAAAPGDPEPPTITEGLDLLETGFEAQDTIGAQGALTEWPESSTTLRGTRVIEDVVFTNRNLTIASGADITLVNCKVIGAYGSTGDTIRNIQGGGARLQLIDSTVICRTAAGGRKNISGYGDVSLSLLRTVVRGGTDGIHFHGTGAPIYPTGDPRMPLATFLMAESWIGDNERVEGSHSDLFQSAKTTGTISNYAFLRSRFMGYSIGIDDDTLVTTAHRDTHGWSSVCFIDTSDNPTGPWLFDKNAFEGGNYQIQAGASEGWLTGNRFGHPCRFGPTRGFTDGWVNTDNRWYSSGEYGTGPVKTAVAGELIPGSTA